MGLYLFLITFLFPLLRVKQVERDEFFHVCKKTRLKESNFLWFSFEHHSWPSCDKMRQYFISLWCNINFSFLDLANNGLIGHLILRAYFNLSMVFTNFIVSMWKASPKHLTKWFQSTTCMSGQNWHEFQWNNGLYWLIYDHETKLTIFSCFFYVHIKIPMKHMPPVP